LDDISSSVSALDARVADSNPAEFTRKVERLEERLNNVVKALDRIQDNDNPLSM
jgi:acetolactate synthase small subunit